MLGKTLKSSVINDYISGHPVGIVYQIIIKDLRRKGNMASSKKHRNRFWAETQATDNKAGVYISETSFRGAIPVKSWGEKYKKGGIKMRKM